MNTNEHEAGNAERRLVTRRQAAKYLGLSVRTIHNLVDRGELEPVRIGRAVRFDVGDFDRLIARAKHVGVSTASADERPRRIQRLRLHRTG